MLHRAWGQGRYDPAYALVLRTWRPSVFQAGVYFEALPVKCNL